MPTTITVSCNICEQPIDLKYFDFLYLSEDYWLSKSRNLSHGECWNSLTIRQKHAGIKRKTKTKVTTY